MFFVKAHVVISEASLHEICKEVKSTTESYNQKTKKKYYFIC